MVEQLKNNSLNVIKNARSAILDDFKNSLQSEYAIAIKKHDAEKLTISNNCIAETERLNKQCEEELLQIKTKYNQLIAIAEQNKKIQLETLENNIKDEVASSLNSFQGFIKKLKEVQEELETVVI